MDLPMKTYVNCIEDKTSLLVQELFNNALLMLDSTQCSARLYQGGCCVSIEKDEELVSLDFQYTSQFKGSIGYMLRIKAEWDDEKIFEIEATANEQYLGRYEDLRSRIEKRLNK